MEKFSARNLTVDLFRSHSLFWLNPKKIDFVIHNKKNISFQMNQAGWLFCFNKILFSSNLCSLFDFSGSIEI